MLLNDLKHYIFTIIAVSIFFTSCEVNEASDIAKYELISGERYYGGTFNLSESEKIVTLYPPHITDAASQRIATQIYEGLVKIDQSNVDGPVLPAIAKSYTVDSSGTVYTFNLDKSVYFHDDPCFKNGIGRNVKATDFVACFKRLCLENNTPAYELILKDKIIGANEFFEQQGEIHDIEGIRALNDYTLQIQLVEPYSSFLYLLSTTYCFVYPIEAYSSYKDKMHVGSGPFKVIERTNDSIILAKNEKYYKVDEFGNQLPYLDTIVLSYIEDKSQSVEQFLKGNLDMLYRVSTNDLLDIMEVDFDAENKVDNNYIQQRTPELYVHFYELLNQQSVFEDKNLRKAFSYAINRQLILDKVLDGAGYAPGIYGITPPILNDYDVTQIAGYEFNVEKAVMHLKKAGYRKGGEVEPITLLVNKGGGLNVDVAKEVKRQLKENLDITINIEVLPFNEKINRTINAKYIMARSGWVADYASPETFLSLLYGKNVPESINKPSFPNISRYVNEKFDYLFEKGAHAQGIGVGKGYFLQAEKLAMEDAPLIILWYDENYRILQPYVRDFPNNPMQFRDLSTVWFDFSIMHEKERNSN